MNLLQSFKNKSFLSNYSSGNITWQKSYGGSRDDESYYIKQTSDGGYIAGGITASFGAGSRNGWILKLIANQEIKELIEEIDWLRSKVEQMPC